MSVASFTGKVAMITGAAGSLGRAVAAAFAAQGARLALLDLKAAALEAAYGAEGETRLHLAADLGDGAAVAEAVDEARARFGRIDVLCNIAGGFHMGEPVHETPDAVFRQMIELNAGSVLRMARAVVPVMLAQGGGKIVSVAAMGGLTGGATMSAYAASKSAVIRLTESMALELRDRGINVNCVLPSTIDTAPNRASMPNADFTRWVAPAALADVILFLASDAARAVNGVALPVVGRV
ncbi:MAG TPA: SDR family NAD(P)-dependent oxidoreductase [Stellaceae bacterium]|nr:SDR family NAD(P)-dependent oxidoreductase [Stellaceae bacterium]